jgi:phospholipase/lecithinase/hemolysin
MNYVQDPSSHLFKVKCAGGTSPSGRKGSFGGHLPGAGLSDGIEYDDRTREGQLMLAHLATLEAQRKVTWTVLYYNKSGNQWGRDDSKTYAGAQKKAQGEIKGNSFWGKDSYVYVGRYEIVAEYDCGGGDSWADALKKQNPSVPPGLMELTLDSLIQPPGLLYANMFERMAGAFLARHGAGSGGNFLFRSFTGNFYPDSGTPGGVIGEYAQMHEYSHEMLARLRQMLQGQIDNNLAGITYSLEAIREGLQFTEELQGSAVKYLMPNGKSFYGSYNNFTPDAFAETLGPDLFRPHTRDEIYIMDWIYHPSEVGTVSITANGTGQRITIQSAIPGRRSVIDIPDLSSFFNPDEFLPGAESDLMGGIGEGADIQVTYYGTPTPEWAISQGVLPADVYIYYMPAFRRWLNEEHDPATLDPVDRGILDYYKENNIRWDPLLTWICQIVVADVGARVTYFYRADGNHMVHVNTSLGDRQDNKFYESLRGLGQLVPGTSLDDRVPLRITFPSYQTLTIPVGGTLNLNGTILGKGPVTDIKWRVNNVAVQTGSATLVKQNMRPQDSGYYTLTARNPDGVASSLPVLVEVQGGPADDNANLMGLDLGNAKVSSPFANLKTAYTADVSSSTPSTTVIATADPGATLQVRVNGGSYSSFVSGATSLPLPLNSGSNVIEVQVTAPNGTTRKTYTITVTKHNPTSNAGLSSLEIGGMTLTPAFASGTLAYTGTVSPQVNGVLTATPVVAQAGATVAFSLNGGSYQTVASGTPSAPLILSPGRNRLEVLVRAPDGVTTTTYRVLLDSNGAASYAGMYVLGDGLSDTGRSPAPVGYFNGRWSNGPLWPEQFSERLGLAYDASRNFARAEALTAGLGAQVGQIGQVSANQLCAIWSGANDLLNLITLAEAENDTEWDNAITNAVQNIVTTARSLYEKGGRGFLFFAIPDLRKLPKMARASAGYRGFVAAKTIRFNSTLAAKVNVLLSEKPGMTAHMVDVFGLLNHFIYEPSAEGFTVTTMGALNDPALADKSFSGAGANYLFWDDRHFTTKMHSEISELAGDLLGITPSPTPSVITSQPVSQMVIVGQGATFSVTATGGGLTYQWRKNGTPIPGATAASLTLNNVTRAAIGTYSVVVTSGGIATPSGDALLRVIVPQRLQPPQRGGGGQFQLRFADPDGGLGGDLSRFEVHHTTNFLGASTVWVTNTVPLTLSNGKILFDDTGSIGSPRRFYRVIEK